MPLYGFGIVMGDLCCEVHVGRGLGGCLLHRSLVGCLCQYEAISVESGAISSVQVAR